MQRTSEIEDPENKPFIRNRAVLSGLLFGALMSSLTLSIQKWGAPSQIPFIGDLQAVQAVLATSLFPGMLGAALLSRNAHAWHLWVAALLNGIIYFALVWLASRVIGMFFKDRQT